MLYRNFVDLMISTSYIKICIILYAIITGSNSRGTMHLFHWVSLNYKGYWYKNANIKKMELITKNSKESLKKVVVKCIQLDLLDLIGEEFLFLEFQRQSNLVIHNRD